MKFKGSALKLTSDDITRTAQLLGAGEDEVHAVLDVEASGSGFDSAGRPKMLFEPHVFYRNLAGTKRTNAVAAGLAYKDWKPGSYPKDSYPRLTRAMEIDETAALKAASWGLGQILGENHKAAGFPTPQDMVTAFCESEAAQLIGMAAFIKTNKLDDNLRAHDWAGFARGYNGPAYAKHGYHTKLANAYAKWSRIPDTPLGKDVPPFTLPGDVPKPTPAPKKKPKLPGAGTATTGTVATGGAAGAAKAAGWGNDWVIGIVAFGLTVTVAAALIVWSRRRKPRSN